MQDTIAELLDHHAIRQLLDRYCRGVDRQDEALINSVYWEDSTDNHGIYTGPGPGFGAFIIPYLRGIWTRTMHVVGQSVIAVEGDRAAAETYCTAYHTRADGAGEAVDIAGCRYVDRLERRAGEWRILDRVVVMDWVSTLHNPAGTGIDLERFDVGRTDATDTSYRTFEWLKAGDGTA